MKNRTIAHKVFKYMKENGFIPYDIEYGNGYFIFEMGDDSVVHFKVKGLRNWKFGMWINAKAHSSEVPMVQFFTQHEDHIDKFKPSRSFFSCNLSYDDICHADTYCYEVREILRHIKKHPLVAYEQDDSGIAYCEKSYLAEYVKGKFRIARTTLRDKWEFVIPVLQHKYKTYFLTKSEIVDHVDFIDNNEKHSGFIVSPRYDMIIHFKKIYDEDKQTDLEYDLLRRWFKSELGDYSNIHISCRRNDISGSYYYDLWKEET